MQRRTGLIAKKLGMSRILMDDGTQVPVTLLELSDCRVVGQKTQERDGYTALCLGLGQKKLKKVSRAEKEKYAQLNVSPPLIAKEFRVSQDAMVDIGSYLSATHFVSGQTVDATATSIGRGFAGVMKRHNFSGLRASHGVSVSHRSRGTTGMCQDPGRVFKGTKMAGQMGNKQITMHNLEVHSVDAEKSLLFVKGSMPGSDGAYVFLRDAIKKSHKDLPFPAELKPAPVSLEAVPASQKSDKKAASAKENLSVDVENKTTEAKSE